MLTPWCKMLPRSVEYLQHLRCAAPASTCGQAGTSWAVPSPLLRLAWLLPRLAAVAGSWPPWTPPPAESSQFKATPPRWPACRQRSPRLCWTGASRPSRPGTEPLKAEANVNPSKSFTSPFQRAAQAEGRRSPAKLRRSQTQDFFKQVNLLANSISTYLHNDSWQECPSCQRLRREQAPGFCSARHAAEQQHDPPSEPGTEHPRTGQVREEHQVQP